jgi:chromosome segregation ATPase
MLVWIDFPNDKSLVPEKFVARNKALSEQYGVEGFPTYVVLDDDGKSELGRLGADRGATPEQFISQAKALLQARASVVEALLKTVPAAAAEEYRATNKELAGARAELKELEAAFEKKSQALREQIEKQDRRLADIRTEARLSALPKEKADQYRAKQKRLSAAQDELKAWIATGPARNEENQKKHAGWRDEIGALEKDMRQLLGD